MTPRPMKFLLPGLFLLVLGLGNILVGSFKEHQYLEVYQELSVLEPAPDTARNSALGRIHTAKQTNDRFYRRQAEASDRRTLYRLVHFGGRVFVTLSALLLFLAGVCRLLERSAERPASGDLKLQNSPLSK